MGQFWILGPRLDSEDPQSRIALYQTGLVGPDEAISHRLSSCAAQNTRPENLRGLGAKESDAVDCFDDSIADHSLEGVGEVPSENSTVCRPGGIDRKLDVLYRHRWTRRIVYQNEIDVIDSRSVETGSDRRLAIGPSHHHRKVVNPPRDPISPLRKAPQIAFHLGSSSGIHCNHEAPNSSRGQSQHRVLQ
jgi:hypothetical protein